MTKPKTQTQIDALAHALVDQGEALSKRIDRVEGVAKGAQSKADLATNAASSAKAAATSAQITAEAARNLAKVNRYAYPPPSLDPYRYAGRFAPSVFDELYYRYRQEPPRSQEEAVHRELHLRYTIERLQDRVVYVPPIYHEKQLTNVSAIPAWSRGDEGKVQHIAKGELRTYEGRIYVKLDDAAIATVQPPTKATLMWRELGPVA